MVGFLLWVRFAYGDLFVWWVFCVMWWGVAWMLVVLVLVGFCWYVAVCLWFIIVLLIVLFVLVLWLYMVDCCDLVLLVLVLLCLTGCFLLCYCDFVALFDFGCDLVC